MWSIGPPRRSAVFCGMVCSARWSSLTGRTDGLGLHCKRLVRMLGTKPYCGGYKAVTLYETLFVVHPEKGARMKEFIERFKKVIEGQQGTVAHVDEWGSRDLAYRIDKQGKGFYTLFQYSSSARAVEELERNLRPPDGTFCYLTLRAA